MKNTKNLIAALLLAGGSMIAAEPLFVKNDASNEFLKTKPQLTFKKKSASPFSALNRSFSGSGREWNMAEVSGGGLFINFGIHFLPKNFLNPYYESGDPRFKIGFDFEFGNFFRFAKVEDGMVGIGLRITWLSFAYGAMSDGPDVYRVLQMMPLKLGPQVSIALTEEMGVDVFYQIGVNIIEQFGSIDDPIESKNIGKSITYIGANNEVGAAFHYKVFSLGLGYRFGKVKMISYVYDGDAADSELYNIWPKSNSNNFRITLGFKF